MLLVQVRGVSGGLGNLELGECARGFLVQEDSANQSLMGMCLFEGWSLRKDCL